MHWTIFVQIFVTRKYTLIRWTGSLAEYYMHAYVDVSELRMLIVYLYSHVEFVEFSIETHIASYILKILLAM